jgi:hypothetical protein
LDKLRLDTRQFESSAAFLRDDQIPNAWSGGPMKKFALSLMVAALVGCGGGGDDDGVQVVSESRTLGEGIVLSYALTAATYTVEITSSNNGVVVGWLGGSGAGCATSAEVNTYQTTCALTIQGQLTITNPTTLGLGGSEIVTIRVTRR